MRHALPERPRAAPTPGPTRASPLPPQFRSGQPGTAGTPLQFRATEPGGAVAAFARSRADCAARAANRTGLPDHLKNGIEALSGIALDDVRVHRNSARPAQLQALAHTQGNDIHLGPGQERHLPHEAWHVIQQKQGRVRPTTALGGTAINDDAGLEHEADRMGSRAMRGPGPAPVASPVQLRTAGPVVVQRAIGYEVEIGMIRVKPGPNATVALKKGLQLWKGKGWDASADETEAGFDLEFRTGPIDDIDPGGREDARRRLTAISKEWTAIESSKVQPIPSRPKGMLIRSSMSSNLAQFQASVGLSLDALRSVRTGAALEQFQPDAREELDEETLFATKDVLGTGGSAQLVTHDVDSRKGEIREALGLGPDENIDNLCAVISLIIHIPMNAASSPLDYAKAASAPILARSDYVTVMRMLPPNQLHAIQTHPTQWTDTVLRILHLSMGTEEIGSHDTSPVFPRGAFKKRTAHTDFLSDNLSRHDWIQGLAHGEDRLTARDFETRHGATHEKAAQELESLGSYGGLMDASRYEDNYRGYLLMAAGIAAMGVGIAAGLTTGVGGSIAATGAAATALGYARRKTPIRDRPIFELRDLGMTTAQSLVRDGLAVWDYVQAAHGKPVGGTDT
ncbi:DUF4157 domain-containing protein [Sphingomonas sp. Sphisp140]|uniref:eCIS core domain-containing protein n=1 Tax=unclassified Sphingomonas TaxID=196159 RepID=UPI0039B05BE9